jgi:putative hydrolase of the HAD superfamily
MSLTDKKWVVFDLGGVLLGWDMPLLQQHFDELKCLRDPTEPLVKRFFAQPEWKAFDRGEVTGLELAQALAKREASSVQQMEQAVEVIRKSLVPMPDKVAFLQALAKRRDAGEAIGLAYLSNMPVPYAAQLLANQPWFAWFDQGVFSGNLGCMKPDPAIFAHMETLTGAKPQNHLFIDDYPHNLPPATQRGWATSHAAFERDYTVDVLDWLNR